MLSAKPWRTEAVIQLIAGVFVCLCLGVTVAGVLRQAGVAAFKSPDSFAGVLLATLSFQGAAWILILIFLKLHAVNWRDAFGFNHSNLKKPLLLAVFVWILILPVILLLEQGSALVLEKLGWPPEDQRAVDLILNAKSWWMRGYLAFFAVVLVPVAEEFLFRGLLYPFIKQRGWPKLAWIGVSLLFALIHLNAPTFLPLFVFALVLTWLYEKTDCLLAPIVTHGLFNSANLIILFTLPR
ncbi:MAG: type II CAAX endopeptidase family protein [Verrucomicrobiota bacterium]